MLCKKLFTYNLVSADDVEQILTGYCEPASMENGFYVIHEKRPGGEATLFGNLLEFRYDNFWLSIDKYSNPTFIVPEYITSIEVYRQRVR